MPLDRRRQVMDIKPGDKVARRATDRYKTVVDVRFVGSQHRSLALVDGTRIQAHQLDELFCREA